MFVIGMEFYTGRMLYGPYQGPDLDGSMSIRI